MTFPVTCRRPTVKTTATNVYDRAVSMIGTFAAPATVAALGGGYRGG